jgi:hypothetical protein
MIFQDFLFRKCRGGICRDEELDLPSLYWIPKLHKCPFKQPYIDGSAKCSTKPLSKLLTCIRDRPFNLKGGGYGFLFRSEFFFQGNDHLT